jgi:aminopeptidase N
MKPRFPVLLGWLPLTTLAVGPLAPQTIPESSGGFLLPEQAAYDVRFYDLALRLYPADSALEGVLTMRAKVVHPLERVVLNLDPRLAVETIAVAGEGPDGGAAEATFERRTGELWIGLRRTRQPGEDLAVTVSYAGKPLSAPEGSFGSFIWGSTPDGQPWITVNCEIPGADIWWPVKDHPSDEPDSMALHLTVPSNLTAVSNGRRLGVRGNADGTRTFDWLVSTPINNYGVSLNVAPYVEVQSSFESVSGASVPVTFWVLPESRDRAAEAMPEFLDHMRHLEDLLGPYPFQSDKYGIAQTNYLGMEHQTIIAYGAEFRNDAMGGIDWGFDALHQHELAHEWFGNLLTPHDFRDLWLNEGFAQYAQVLYAESRLGKDKAAELLTTFRSRLDHAKPVAPRHAITAGDAYSRDLYWKGAWALHTLRTLIGEEAFFTLLRRWTYPSPKPEDVRGGCACRFVSTDEFQALAEQISGRSLGWFFEAYLRREGVPRLRLNRVAEGVRMRWEGFPELPEPIPVELRVGNRVIVLPVGLEEATLSVPEGAEITVDPAGRLLFETVWFEPGE